jgi:hypothetical protein
MLRRAWWPVGLAVLVLAAGCGKPNPPKVLPPTIDGNTLPQAALDALDEKWPHKGWQMTTVDPQVVSCLPKGTPAKEVVTADFDSDGMSDIAATVMTPNGVRLVVLMARTWGYDVYDVDGLGEKVSSVSLGLEPRGKRYTNLAANLQNNYSADAITTFVCGTTRVSYLWSGNGYYKVTVAK